MALSYEPKNKTNESKVALYSSLFEPIKIWIKYACNCKDGLGQGCEKSYMRIEGIAFMFDLHAGVR